MVVEICHDYFIVVVDSSKVRTCIKNEEEIQMRKWPHLNRKLKITEANAVNDKNRTKELS